MAPNLSVAQHEQLAGMIEFSALSDAQIAEQAGCSQRAVRRIRSNLRHFDSTKARPNGGGRPSSITPPMMSALCDHLLERPTLYQDEMAEYLMAEFGGHVSKYAVRRVLTGVDRLVEETDSSCSPRTECGSARLPSQETVGVLVVSP
jgi:transposase